MSIVADPPRGTDVLDLERATLAGLDAWQALDCEVVRPVYIGSGASRAESGDRVVTVQRIATGWSAHGFAADAAAATDVVYGQGDDGEWEIIDADVYINDEAFAWGSVGSRPRADLRSALLHELGHVLGLLHPCEPEGAGGAPACGGSGEIASVMDPLYPLDGRILLEPDDAAGMCFLYGDRGCGGPCPADQVCLESSCVPARCAADPCLCDPDLAGCRPEGGIDADPCSSSEECQGQVCDPGGWCTRNCIAEASCSSGFRCDPSTAGGQCIPQAGVFGEACDVSDDCTSDVCLDTGDGAAQCTRACDEHSPCPGDQQCTLVDGRPVCAPPPSRGGCSVSPGNQADPYGLLAAIGAVLATVRRRRP